MRDWIAKDFHWKAFSLLMAIGIWLTFSRPSGTTAAQAVNHVTQPYPNVPVVPISTDANVRSTQIFPQTVTVTISGPPEIMNRVERNDIHAFVNLTGFSSANSLSRDVEVALPAGTSIVSVDPPQAAVTIPKQQ